MRKRSVRKRIFISNTLMVVVTLAIFFVINLFIIRGYIGSVERAFAEHDRHLDRTDDVEDMIDEWTVERDEFVIAFAADGVICIISLLLISQLFTRNLTRHIMEPLDALTEGAKRIEKNDLHKPVVYKGEREFENVCRAFNDMQASILAEQEKNRRYEKAREDMIAGISHDLRTPLTAIKGTIKGLKDGVASTPAQRERFLDAAYRRTGEMDALLGQLLYFSRMETGNVRLHMQELELSYFLREYASAKQQEIHYGNEILSLRAGNEKVVVSADPEQFLRILDNLYENSRKYAETVPLEIDISLKCNAGNAEICFHDNGRGVPAEKLPHVFEEFYRGDESRNQKEGNGLGLYIVKYLMEAMGGSARAENADGFAVYLRLPVLQKGNENGRESRGQVP